ncbi:lipopolysaccharide biosynthesis protein [Sphingomonas sp. M1A8_2b]
MSIGDRLPSRFRAKGALGAVLRNFGWLLASRGLMAVLSLFYIGFVTRSLGVKDFGRFALVTGAAQALTMLVGFQTWQIIVRYGVDAVKHDDDTRLARLFRACAILDLTSAIVGTVLAILILEFWGEAFGIGPTLLRATLIFTVIQLLTIRSTPVGILRLRDRYSSAALADSVTPLVRFAGAVVVMFVHPTLQGFLFAWGVAELVTASIYWWFVVQCGDWRRITHGHWLGWRQVIAENKGFLRFAASTNTNTTLNIASKQIPLLVIGAYVGPSAAGRFRLAAQLAQALAKMSQLLSRAAFAEVVRMVDRNTIARLLRRMVSGSILGSLVILAVVAAIGRQALELIGGPGFGIGYPVLLGLAAAGCVELTIVGLETVLIANGRADTALMARAVGVGVVALSAWLLVPVLASLGMALAVLLGSLAAGVILGGAAFRLTRQA